MNDQETQALDEYDTLRKDYENKMKILNQVINLIVDIKMEETTKFEKAIAPLIPFAKLFLMKDFDERREHCSRSTECEE